MQALVTGTRVLGSDTQRTFFLSIRGSRVSVFTISGYPAQRYRRPCCQLNRLRMRPKLCGLYRHCLFYEFRARLPLHVEQAVFGQRPPNPTTERHILIEPNNGRSLGEIQPPLFKTKALAFVNRIDQSTANRISSHSDKPTYQLPDVCIFHTTKW